MQAGSRVLSSCELTVVALFVLCRHAIAEAKVGVDEAPTWESPIELDPELADVDIDGSVPVAHVATPNEAEELLAGNNSIHAPRELCQQAQLADGEHQGAAARPGEVLIREDLERPDIENLAMRWGRRRHVPRMLRSAAQPGVTNS